MYSPRLTSPSPGRQSLDQQASEASSTLQRGRRFWAIPLVMLVLVLLVLVALALIADSSSRAGISSMSQILATLVAFGCSIRIMRRESLARARSAWRWIIFALAYYLVAEIIAVVISFTPSISYLAGAFFIPFYFLLAVGVLRLPAAQRTGTQQFRVLLDVLIGIGALFGLDLVFLITPRFVSSTPANYIYIFYPIADFTLLLVAALLLVRGVERVYRPALFWLILGMLCFVYADSAQNYVSLPSPTTENAAPFGLPIVDPFWVAGMFAFSLAPLSLLILGARAGDGWGWLDTFIISSRESQRTRTLSQLVLLTTPAIILFGLLAYVDVQPQHTALAALSIIGLAFIVMLLIITRLLFTMRDLVDARIATERAEQLDELKDQFITSVNHELRTPLMTMAGYLEMLTMPQVRVTASKQADMLGRASKQSKTLINLVQSILDTRRIDQEASDFTPEVVHLATAAQTALTLIDPGEADPNSRIIALQVPDSLVVWGESVRVQQILTNLISNAIKYSPPDTPVTVRAALVAEQTGRLSSRSGQRIVEIKVQDQGLGIPPEQKDLLFRRFVRLPRDIASTTRGTGLGLYLCRVFAEAMGGSVRVESTGVPGEGSTFYVRLPLPPAQNSGSAPQRVAPEGILR